jgi:hypothetical protein
VSDDFTIWGTELECPGCGGEITPRYALKGACSDCYGTTDDLLSTISNAAALE